MTDDGWITMQLNDCFHYGQNSSGDDASRKIKRWMAYHPIASPAIFQVLTCFPSPDISLLIVVASFHRFGRGDCDQKSSSRSHKDLTR